jgi:hypothetical protein
VRAAARQGRESAGVNIDAVAVAEILLKLRGEAVSEGGSWCGEVVEKLIRRVEIRGENLWIARGNVERTGGLPVNNL